MLFHYCPGKIKMILSCFASIKKKHHGAPQTTLICIIGLHSELHKIVSLIIPYCLILRHKEKICNEKKQTFWTLLAKNYDDSKTIWFLRKCCYLHKPYLHILRTGVLKQKCEIFKRHYDCTYLYSIVHYYFVNTSICMWWMKLLAETCHWWYFIC